MLRYMIYETKSDRVLLSKEIIYIKNYILLQQLRFREKDYIKISFPGSCDRIQIAPMILLPFIENAFKYAFNMEILPVIEIIIQCKGNSLYFSCQNYYNKERPLNDSANGMGLKNVKRRLELLYPEKYRLSIFDKNSIFKVELTIQLT